MTQPSPFLIEWATKHKPQPPSVRVRLLSGIVDALVWMAALVAFFHVVEETTKPPVWVYNLATGVLGLYMGLCLFTTLVMAAGTVLCAYTFSVVESAFSERSLAKAKEDYNDLKKGWANSVLYDTKGKALPLCNSLAMVAVLFASGFYWTGAVTVSSTVVFWISKLLIRYISVKRLNALITPENIQWVEGE